MNLKIHRLHDSLIVYVQSRFLETSDKKFYFTFSAYSYVYNLLIIHLYPIKDQLISRIFKKIFEINLFENLNEQISFYIFNLFFQKLLSVPPWNILRYINY